jgi:hypothetical protein
MNTIKAKIEGTYPSLVMQARDLVPALIAVLTRQKLSLEGKVPGMEITVEQLLSLGLFRWNGSTPVGYLDCPFVLIWLLSTWSKDRRLYNYQLDAYNEIQSQTDPGIPKGIQLWQHWEERTALFRILKSSLLAGNVVPLSTLHAGALLRLDSDPKIKVTELKLVRATKQYITNPKDGTLYLSNI